MQNLISQGKEVVRDLKQNILQDVPKTWAEFIAAWDASDVPRIVACFAPDASYQIVPLAVGAEGQAGIQACFSLFRGAGHDSFPNLKRERLSLTVGQNSLVDESVFTWQHTAVAHEILPGVAPTGKQLSVVKITVVTFSDQDPNKLLSGVKIKSFRAYFDSGALHAQLSGGDAHHPFTAPSNDVIPHLKSLVASAEAASSDGQASAGRHGK